MTRKQLPKAFTRKKEELRETHADAATSEQPVSPAARRVSKPPPDEEVPQSASPQNTTIKPAAPASPPISGEVLLAASTPAQPEAAQRFAVARKIVDRHQIYAAVGGLFPLPVVNVAGVTAIIVRMVKQLSDHYQVPFERDRTRSIVMALMGGAVPTGLGSAATSLLAVIVPGAGLAGLAVSSVTAAAFTRGIGMVFVEDFEATAREAGAESGAVTKSAK